MTGFVGFNIPQEPTIPRFQFIHLIMALLQPSFETALSHVQLFNPRQPSPLGPLRFSASLVFEALASLSKPLPKHFVIFITFPSSHI